VGGLIAFVLGSVFLFDSGDAGDEVRVAWSVILGAGGGLAAFLVFVGMMVARRRPEATRFGAEGMIGAVGTARDRLDPHGTIVVRGEYWTAESDEVVDPGASVEIVAVDGLRLRVRRVRTDG
jgi:membrane-bound serine protease (ClpP class)